MCEQCGDVPDDFQPVEVEEGTIVVVEDYDKRNLGYIQWSKHFNVFKIFGIDLQ